MNFHKKHLSLLFLGHYIMHTSIFLLNSASKLNKVMIINTGTCIHGPKLVEMNSLICKCVIFYIYIKMNYINLYIYMLIVGELHHVQSVNAWTLNTNWFWSNHVIYFYVQVFIIFHQVFFIANVQLIVHSLHAFSLISVYESLRL